MAASSGSSTSPAAPTPPPPSGPGGTATPAQAATAAAKPFPKMLVLIVVVVVAAAAILGGLFAAGVFNSSAKSNSSGGGGGTGQTFSQAASTAQGSVGSVVGGPWTLIGGGGTIIASSIAVNQTELNASSSNGGCQAHLLSGASSVTSIPSTTSSASSGESNAWVVWYSNATLGILEVAVFGGSATPILTESTYGSCETTVSSVTLPTGYVDSPTAAAAAYNNGGSTWIASWPQYDIEEILVPGTSIAYGGISTQIPSTWEVTYTTCNIGADDGSTLGGQAASQFTASVYSSNGTFERGLTTSTSCSSAGGGGGGGKAKLASCVGYFAEENEAATYWNNGTAVCSSVNTLTTGDLTVSITNASTHAAVNTAGFVLEVRNITSGAVLSTYNFNTESWSAAGVGVLATSDALNFFVLITPSTMAGNDIVFTATASAPATGSLSVALGTT